MVIAHQAPAFTALPTKVHEKLARSVKPEDELAVRVFKRRYLSGSKATRF
jgi:hypothetical protein